MVACDKLHNAMSILRDMGRSSVGGAVWKRFSADRAEVLWYYGAAGEALAHQWDHELLDELRRTVARLGQRPGQEQVCYDC